MYMYIRHEGLDAITYNTTTYHDLYITISCNSSSTTWLNNNSAVQEK